MEESKLDSLGIYSGKYPVGQWPTKFVCSICGAENTLEFMKYDPYTNTRYCISCEEKHDN